VGASNHQIVNFAGIALAFFRIDELRPDAKDEISPNLALADLRPRLAQSKKATLLSGPFRLQFRCDLDLRLERRRDRQAEGLTRLTE
jgi:hypothetical protein